MKRLLTKYVHGGVGFSKNGHEAYIKGERPEFMFTSGALIEPTIAHHIEIKVGRTYKRPLVMFYKKAI